MNPIDIKITMSPVLGYPERIKAEGSVRCIILPAASTEAVLWIEIIMKTPDGARNMKVFIPVQESIPRNRLETKNWLHLEYDVEAVKFEVTDIHVAKVSGPKMKMTLFFLFNTQIDEFQRNLDEAVNVGVINPVDGGMECFMDSLLLDFIRFSKDKFWKLFSYIG